MVASSIEAMWSENQEIPGGSSLFLLSEVPLNKSRNLGFITPSSINSLHGLDVL